MNRSPSEISEGMHLISIQPATQQSQPDDIAHMVVSRCHNSHETESNRYRLNHGQLP